MRVQGGHLFHQRGMVLVRGAHQQPAPGLGAAIDDAQAQHAVDIRRFAAEHARAHIAWVELEPVEDPDQRVLALRGFLAFEDGRWVGHGKNCGFS